MQETCERLDSALPPSSSRDDQTNERCPVELETGRTSVVVTPLPSGRNRIVVRQRDASQPVKIHTWETAYGLELIKLILAAKGPAFLCDEIARDESPQYAGAALQWALLGYVDHEALDGTRILDFGCGSGASTTMLARMFPTATIIGVDIGADLLAIARARARFYALDNVEFVLSERGNTLPAGLGRFDHIVLCAVYEHLLPDERAAVLPMLWASLAPGGVLFIRETPHRYFPIETHTIGGLPLLNYLPDRAALWVTRRFSGYWPHDVTWDQLLRAGIRGGTIGELKRILRSCPGPARLLEPNHMELEDRIDLWYRTTEQSKHSDNKRRIYALLKRLKRVTGVEFPPYLELAFRKEPG